jgi:protocatechuate 4,5-dioxygenase beta chain
MAELVGAFGVPHTPMYPDLVKREGPQCAPALLYGAVRKHLEELQPDALLIFDSDHLSTFFFNNLPTFCVGASPLTAGPNDLNANMPHYEVSVSERLAQHVHQSGVEGGFDLSLSQEFEVDHSILVPLHFLTPKMNVPIAPVFINGLAPPLPSAKRCLSLGKMVGESIKSWPKDMKVAILASGSFSLEVSGPRVGMLDTEWMDIVLRCLGNAEAESLAEQATTDRMLAAGNVAGELLNWIALLGAIGKRKPVFLEPEQGQGHAYAAWRWD